MAPPITQVLLVDHAIEDFGKEMVDTAHAGIRAPGSMAAGFKLRDETVRAFTPLGSGERIELSGHEIAGVRGGDVQETRFIGGITQRLNRRDMLVRDFHSDRISAVSSC